ncbi:MAG TPA: ParB/RepB/Spo0J family partition protein, partial [Isosphaeraceae bacterium]|nr:ParB/RepB/Spo0J family partition protein [Isosphaeraceae bacterium]
LLTSTIEGAELTEVPPAAEPRREVRLDSLWLDHQPREIVPEEVLQRLIDEDRAQPAALLAALEEAAGIDPYYQGVLERLRGLARSIQTQGVLQPIEVVAKHGRLVVRDGHRRCLASLLAGRETVPMIEVEEPSELEAVARPLIVNVQREDLTAVEKGAALLRLARLVARRLAEEDGAAAGAVSLEELLGGSSPDADEEDGGTTGPTAAAGEPRALAAAVRERVCAMVGLQPRTYYRLLALNRLTPTARAIGRHLTENQLRPIVALPAEEQAEIVAFAVKRGLSSKEIATLARVVRSGDRDAVARVMARLAREEAGRRRTAVSWEPLLHAVPRDLWRRCQALRAELEALPGPQREARLAAMWEQARLLRALAAEFEEIFTAHGYTGPADPSEVVGQ